MRQFFSRWFRRHAAAPEAGHRALREWAAVQGLQFKSVREEGVVVEGRTGAQTWRLEWGPSQRSYVQGNELRLRTELGFGAELQLVVLNRHLKQTMERQVFEQYVEGVKTQIDDQTPPEMRWLVMFPQLSAVELGVLRETFAAGGNLRSWLQAWLHGPLSSALAAGTPSAEHPLVLMIGRGRLVLRTQCADPEPVHLSAWLRLFEVATEAARRTHEQMSPRAPGDGPRATR